jgi:hypothetical protein
LVVATASADGGGSAMSRLRAQFMPVKDQNLSHAALMPLSR